MAASPSPRVIQYHGRKAVLKFIEKLVAAEPRAVSSGKAVYLGLRRVEVSPRVIRASNGEVALWPMAVVYDAHNNIVKVFNEAPWMPGGCSVEVVKECLVKEVP